MVQKAFPHKAFPQKAFPQLAIVHFLMPDVKGAKECAESPCSEHRGV